MRVTKQWQSVNSVEGVTVGSLFKLKNNSITSVIVKSSPTIPVDEHDSVSLTGDRELIISPFSDIVWVKTNSSGSADLFVEQESPFIFNDSGLDPRLYTGTKALTVQPFVEANVKNGTQFESSTYLEALPRSPTSIDTVFITSSKDVLIKAQSLDLNGAGVKIEIFKAPTYTVGAGQTNPIYNLSDAADTPESTVTVVTNVDVTDLGLKVGADLYVLGNNTPSSTDLSAGRIAGLDRRLEKNTTYLRRVTNLSASDTQALYTYTTWYEGPLSNELP